MAARGPLRDKVRAPKIAAPAIRRILNTSLRAPAEQSGLLVALLTAMSAKRGLNRYDGVSDIAGADRSCRHRIMGGFCMSAEIIQFFPRPKHDCEQTDFPTIAFRSAVPDTPTTSHADTAPCEYVQPDWYEK
jgi:hypothetical protein